MSHLHVQINDDLTKMWQWDYSKDLSMQKTALKLNFMWGQAGLSQTFLIPYLLNQV